MKNKTYKLFSIWFWKEYFVQMRPYLLFISGVAAWAGMAITSAYEPMSKKTLLTFIPLFLGYGFGQALTDCFQVDTDRISAPLRPLSKGTIGVKQTLVVSFTGLGIITTILIFLNPWNAVLCLLSIFGLYTYTGVKRNYWWGGPFYNAWIVALLPFMGYLSISGENLLALNDPKLKNLMLSSFFSYSVFVLIGYLKDITADRTAGYKTFAVVFGWNKTVIAATAIITTALAVSSLMIDLSQSTSALLWIAVVIYVVGLLYASCTAKKDEEHSVIPVSATVRGFILLHLAIILDNSYENLTLSLALAGVFYVMFEIALKTRPERIQI